MTFGELLSYLVIVAVFIVGSLTGLTFLFAFATWILKILKDPVRQHTVEDRPGDDYDSWKARQAKR
jgi:hypothetical protein